MSYTFPKLFRRIIPRRPMASSQDAWYLSLLGLAENFRTSNRIKMCIQCLQAVFSFKPPPRVEARTHLQLGNILLQYTKNTDLARTHLEQAVISLPIGDRPPHPSNLRHTLLDFCLSIVVAVAVHQRVRRCQIRGSQCRGRIVPATEPIESGQANSEESR